MPRYPPHGAVLVVASLAACGPSQDDPEAIPPPTPMARLVEAVDWYTGVAGRVDDDRARSLLLEAAESGNAIARMWVVRCYSRGRMGFERDTIRARTMGEELIDEIRAAAEGGETEAVFLMGTAYDEGLGVAVDPTEAAAWFRRAAAEGHVLARHNLGNAYSTGRGVPQSDSTAVRWWLTAAEAGDAIPQLRLGESYEQGKGVPVDLEAAMTWYRRAAERGNAQASAALDRLESRR